MKHFTLIIFLFLLGNTLVVAQSNDDLLRTGSFYSRIGVGVPVDVGSSDGTGIVGVSYIEPFVSDLSNPAHWGSTRFGLATGGLTLQGFQAEDNQSTATNFLVNADYFQMQLPIYRNKLGISASLQPVTRTTFKDFIGNNVQIQENPGTANDTLRFSSQSKGDGGINMLELGAGWKINSKISVGYAASLVFASIDNEFNVVFQDLDFQPVNFTRRTSGAGFGNRIGLYLNLPEMFNSEDALSFGTVVTFPVSLSAEREERSDKIIGNNDIETIVTEDGANLGDGDIDMPLKIHTGFTYRFDNVKSISAETQYEQWSDFSSEFDNSSDLLTDRFKVGVGFRYDPYVLDSDKFLSQFKYKVGASYDSGHIKINGENIETVMFSLGFGFFSPQRNSNSSVDLSFEYGIRGTTKQNLVKENIWGVSLSLNLAEIFFNRPKLE